MIIYCRYFILLIIWIFLQKNICVGIDIYNLLWSMPSYKLMTLFFLCLLSSFIFSTPKWTIFPSNHLFPRLPILPLPPSNFPFSVAASSQQIISNTISNPECLNYILEDWSGLLKVMSLCVTAVVSQEIQNPIPALQHLSSICRVIVARMGQVYLFIYTFGLMSYLSCIR